MFFDVKVGIIRRSSNALRADFLISKELHANICTNGTISFVQILIADASQCDKHRVAICRYFRYFADILISKNCQPDLTFLGECLCSPMG